jgi:hypothetical protein
VPTHYKDRISFLLDPSTCSFPQLSTYFIMPPIRNSRLQRECEHIMWRRSILWLKRLFTVIFDPLSPVQVSSSPYSPSTSPLPSATAAPAATATSPPKPKSDSNSVTRPLNAFFIYRREMRPEIKSMLGQQGKSEANISCILGHMWQDLPEDAQAMYRQRAAAAMKAHVIKNPNYRLPPQKSRKKPARQCLDAKGKQLRAWKADEVVMGDIQGNSPKEPCWIAKDVSLRSPQADSPPPPTRHTALVRFSLSLKMLSSSHHHKVLSGRLFSL